MPDAGSRGIPRFSQSHWLKNYLTTAITFATTIEVENIIGWRSCSQHGSTRTIGRLLRLAETFGVTRDEFVQVVREVVGARAAAVEHDPGSAGGQFDRPRVVSGKRVAMRVVLGGG